MSDRPSGTVTFLFTDIEGSTRLWEERPDEMRVALAHHDALLRSAIEAHRGYVFSTGGDGFAAAFSRAADAIDAARKAQASLAGHPLLRVRMGIHTGEVQERDGDYFGPAVNRAARIMSAGHGGQVLVSATTAEILGRHVSLTGLGEHRLRDLSTTEKLFQLGEDEFPRLRSLDAYPGNLPLQLSSFVGRERELEQVVAAVRDKPLVTLTGAGGVGKTRLAVHVAAELVPRFAGGAWLVELGSISDPDAVPQVIASTLGLRQRDGMTLTQSLVEYLNARSALIVLDNCEHLLDAAAAVAEAVVQASADTRILATSREGLGVSGEHVIVVRSLPSPAENAPLDDASQAAAVRLFIDRARASDAEFTLTEQNVPAVTQLCRRLDGVPFAIELGAARVAALSPEDIVARVDQRFRLLSGGGRASLERHQTLRRTVDWYLHEHRRSVQHRFDSAPPSAGGWFRYSRFAWSHSKRYTTCGRTLDREVCGG